MIYFEEAKESDIPYLKKIWEICFDDTTDYIDFFFDNKFHNCKSIVMRDGEKAIGAMYLMPVSACEYGDIKKGFYGYAIGILPKYRGQGIYARLDKLIYEYITKHSLFYILCPANQKLCEYYKSLGFIENAFVSERTVYSTGTKKSFNISALSAEKYENMRNSCFDNLICWDRNSLEYVLKENEFLGGHNIFIEDEGHFVIARKNGDTLKIIESNVPECRIQQLTDYLCAEYKTKSVLWIFPKSDSDLNVLYGLSRNLKKDNYYLNLILD